MTKTGGKENLCTLFSSLHYGFFPPPSLFIVENDKKRRTVQLFRKIRFALIWASCVTGRSLSICMSVCLSHCLSLWLILYLNRTFACDLRNCISPWTIFRVWSGIGQSFSNEIVRRRTLIKILTLNKIWFSRFRSRQLDHTKRLTSLPPATNTVISSAENNPNKTDASFQTCRWCK